jgi:uncharacterized membrane protein
MEFLAPYHPQITHGPVVLIIVGLLFELIGRALDREWWRKAGLAMLVFGAMGAVLSVLSGNAAGELAEKQGVPESAVDAHEEIAALTMWLGIAALVLRAAAGRLGRLKGVVVALALLVWLAAAVTVGVAAHRGGQLVFQHGAAVKVQGRLIQAGPAPREKAEEKDGD